MHPRFLWRGLWSHTIYWPASSSEIQIADLVVEKNPTKFPSTSVLNEKS